MPKDAFYFSHDYNARNDEKIKALIRKHRMVGYGIYWAIVEDLYNNANALRTDYEGIADDLRVDVSVLKSVINDFDLFVVNKTTFSSNSIGRRINMRNEKSEKARQSAEKRWISMRTHSDGNANAMRDECEGNAIKERKGKEIKGNKRKGGVGGRGETAKGVRFDADKKNVYFADRSKQPLGKNQLEMAKEGKLKPNDITKGIAY